MTCSGDGSYGSGRAHEALLMCANWKLPVVFWCEANGMAQHSSMDKLFPTRNISNLAAGYGIPSHIVDGQDLYTCAGAAELAAAHVRGGRDRTILRAAAEGAPIDRRYASSGL